MNIKDFLATENGARLTNGNRWMIVEQGESSLSPYRFIVYEHKYGARKSTVLIETTDESSAVATLIG